MECPRHALTVGVIPPFGIVQRGSPNARGIRRHLRSEWSGEERDGGENAEQVWFHLRFSRLFDVFRD
jgi:hypothetical protein